MNILWIVFSVIKLKSVKTLNSIRAYGMLKNCIFVSSHFLKIKFFQKKFTIWFFLGNRSIFADAVSHFLNFGRGSVWICRFSLAHCLFLFFCFLCVYSFLFVLLFSGFLELQPNFSIFLVRAKLTIFTLTLL